MSGQVNTQERISQIISQLHGALQKLTGLHRQLMDTVRLEREALVSAAIPKIEEATVAKQALVEAIRNAETARLKCVGELAVLLKKPIRELTLPNVIILIQGTHAKQAEQLRSAYNALTLLIKRITEQNADNQKLVAESLAHIQEMKKNILGESVPKSSTYTAKGQKSGGIGGSRLIHQEA